MRDRERTDPDLTDSFLTARRELLELNGRAQFFKLRNLWSVCIILWITLLLAFHITLAMGVGLKWLDFTTHKWMVPMIVLENFLQVVGMGYIVVRFLYPGASATKGAKAA